MTIQNYLGRYVQDKVTGFTGTITGYVTYLTGCNQVLLVPQVDAQGKVQESHWFDVQRIDFLDRPRVFVNNGETPGCDREAPKR